MKNLIPFGTILGLAIVLILGVVIYDIQSNKFSTISKEVESFSQPVVILDEKNTIKVGILHSLSGTMALSESSVVDATLLAIQEINERGGVLDRKLEPIVVDGKSDPDTFAREAERLITEEETTAIFGGWASASRKTMMPVFEKYDHLLFYPVQYEGLESSPNIVYTGAAPNQQAIPAIHWAVKNIGTNFFLIGSDYVFPKSINEIIKHEISEMNGVTVGEEYVLLGNTDFVTVIDKIIESNPDVIINTINGDSNVAFFQELRQRGVHSDSIPTISLSLGENEISSLDIANVVGDYAAWNYFQSINSPRNNEFISNFKEKYGQHRVISDPMAAGYTGVYLFAKAVEIAGTDDVDEIQKTIKGITLSAPEGVVGVDPETQHLVKTIRMGQIRDDGQFDIVFSSQEPIKPTLYPTYKSKEQWNIFVNALYDNWNQKWSNSEKN